MRKLLTILLTLTTIFSYGQGAACIYMLPDSTIVCTIYNNSGVPNEGDCSDNADAAGAIPINCLNYILPCVSNTFSSGNYCFFVGNSACALSICEAIALPIEMGNFWGESTTEGNVLY